jgi:hypothetical protein
MQVNQPLGPQRLIKRRAFKVPAVPVTPRPGEATELRLHIPVDFAEGHSGVPKIEIVPPTDQKAINRTNHLLNRGRYPSYGHVVYLGARPFQAFLRGNDIQVPSGSM